MILAIRISGHVKIPKKVEESLFRLRMRRKYTAVLLKSTEENIKLLKKLRNYIAYGKISNEGIKLLLEKRGISLDKTKIDSSKVLEQLDKKNLSDIGIKPFFRLHPPIGGIDSKVHFPIRKGVLGDHKDKIEELMRRML